MSFLDLRTYLEAAKQRGELKIIREEVDPSLEIAEIHRRVIAEGGPVLLFEKVKGSPFPVVTNLFGTKSRVDLAFGDEAYKFIKQAASLPEELLPPTIAKLWSKRSFFMQAARVGLKHLDSAPVKCHRVTPPKLTTLPALKTWELDGGPFLTLPLVYTEHPDTGVHNLGIYRMQVFSDSDTGLHIQIGKGGGFHLARAGELGRNLPVNIFLGGSPAVILSAVAPLPENVPELILASLVTGGKLRLASNPSGPLPLLADAEFVLVGESRPAERRPEGPFGDHYGYYSLTHDFPVFRCNTMYHRDKPIFPATVVGKPKQEDFFIGDYLQEMLSPLFPVVMPAVRDLWSYGETGYHSLAAAVVRERYKREAMVSAFRILGEGQLSLTKFLLVIDKPMDLRDFRTVLEYVLERSDFRTDLYLFSNLSMDTLDYAGPKLNEGSKGVLLGMGDSIRTLPRAFHGTLPSYLSHAERFCGGCLALSGPSYKDDPRAAEQVAQSSEFAEWPLVVLCDDARFTASTASSFLWSTFTRFEPAADIYAKNTTLHRFHPSLDVPVVIDARMKPDYPDELFCDQRTAQLVDSRWNSYFEK